MPKTSKRKTIKTVDQSDQYALTDFLLLGNTKQPYWTEYYATRSEVAEVFKQLFYLSQKTYDMIFYVQGGMSSNKGTAHRIAGAGETGGFITLGCQIFDKATTIQLAKWALKGWAYLTPVLAAIEEGNTNVDDIES